MSGFEINFDGLVLLLGFDNGIGVHFLFGDWLALKVLLFFPEFEFANDAGDFFLISLGIIFIADFCLSVRLIIPFLYFLQIGTADILGFGMESGQLDGVGFFVQLEGLCPFGIFVDIFLHKSIATQIIKCMILLYHFIISECGKD